MRRDFTATCYVIQSGATLLIYHKKLKKWLPPGGHIDANETPPEAAIREVLEETGLIVEILPQENIVISRSNARSIERPYMCLLEEIPAYGDQPQHQHMDFIYLARPVGGSENHNLAEVSAMRWFTKEEALALDPDADIFIETQETIAHIL
ncbi:MAG: hypothetical protein JWO53_896 [Chlamydiia bacterium]|nr:hypothetical protein [Chlamydiia bacterium]